jgi:hypothetical protein
VIKEWGTSKYQALPFWEVDYSPKYERHFHRLKALEESVPEMIALLWHDLLAKAQ